MIDIIPQQRKTAACYIAHNKRLWRRLPRLYALSVQLGYIKDDNPTQLAKDLLALCVE